MIMVPTPLFITRPLRLIINNLKFSDSYLLMHNSESGMNFLVQKSNILSSTCNVISVVIFGRNSVPVPGTCGPTLSAVTHFMNALKTFWGIGCVGSYTTQLRVIYFFTFFASSGGLCLEWRNVTHLNVTILAVREWLDDGIVYIGVGSMEAMVADSIVVVVRSMSVVDSICVVESGWAMVLGSMVVVRSMLMVVV
ncbi:unnamed protein product [Citrullus colocynthis]|uniref:Uncharacterized protein n=1 Tax=Citrullus colocynthis TaxID=252529 RepID=A0ABP0YTV8_9ROSI